LSPTSWGADGTQLILSNTERMPQHLFYPVLMNVDLSNYHYARHFKFLKDSEIEVPTENIARKYEKLVMPLYDIIKNLRNQNQLLKEARSRYFITAFNDGGNRCGGTGITHFKRKISALNLKLKTTL
jgi:hypothetical protein